MVLTAHGIDMLIFWIIFFEIAILYFASSTLLAMPPGDAEARLAGLRADADRLGGQQRRGVPRRNSSVMMTSYVPMMAEPASTSA
jgi:cytochrome c oxidase subunit I